MWFGARLCNAVISNTRMSTNEKEGSKLLLPTHSLSHSNDRSKAEPHGERMTNFVYQRNVFFRFAVHTVIIPVRILTLM